MAGAPAPRVGRSPAAVTADHRKAIAGAAQRHRAGPSQDVAVDHQRGAVRRRLARARDHGGAAAILLEGLERARQRDKRPSASRPMQPAASQRMPSPRARVGVRARIGIGGEPLPRREGVAAGADDGEPAVGAAHREASPVGGDQHVRLRRARPPTALAMREQRHAGEPQRRSAAGRARPARRCRAAAARSPNAAMRPTAPGRLATQSATAIIQSMPSPISRQKKPSKPNGIARTPRMPIGMTQADTTGIASRLAITP